MDNVPFMQREASGLVVLVTLALFGAMLVGAVSAILEYAG